MVLIVQLWKYYARRGGRKGGGGARRLDQVIARGNVLQFWLGEELCGDISPINLTSRAFDESILSG